MQKQKELTFYNISRHVVKSNCGSNFPGADLFCTYPISLLLKQSRDNNIVNCIQMIYTEVLCRLEPHFKAYTRIKDKILSRKLILQSSYDNSSQIKLGAHVIMLVLLCSCSRYSCYVISLQYLDWMR